MTVVTPPTTSKGAKPNNAPNNARKQMHFDIYSSPGCSKCKLTANRLLAVTHHDKPIHTVNMIDVTVTPGAYDAALELSGGVKTLPIVKPADGPPWMDFRVDRLKHYGA